MVSLSGDAQFPTTKELKLVFDFQHLADCILRFVLWKTPEIYWKPTPLWPHWKERFYSSLYRVLLSGAVLYREYHELLAVAPSSGVPSNFLDAFRKSVASWERR